MAAVHFGTRQKPVACHARCMRLGQPSRKGEGASSALNAQASLGALGNPLHSLLEAMDHVDGEAMVMHVGEKAYVVTPTGLVDASTRALTLAVLEGALIHLLPPEARESLDEIGAVQYHLPALLEFPRQQFTVVAARDGDEVWVEIRRHRVPESALVPAEAFGASALEEPVFESPRDDALSLPHADEFWPKHTGTSARLEPGTHLERGRKHLEGLDLEELDRLLAPSTHQVNPRRTF